MTASSTPILTIYLIVIAFFYDTTDGFQKDDRLRYATLKSLPIVALAAFHHLHGLEDDGSKRKGWTCTHALGLLFGACGDFVISFPVEGTLVAAAILFGIGHLLYMAKFAKQLKTLTAELTAATLLYAIGVNHFLMVPQLFHAPITTIVLMVYTIILSSALVISGSLYFSGTKTGPARQQDNLMRFAGYSLFFLSDSMLLLEHMGFEWPFSSLLILSTYFSSQYLLALDGVHSPVELSASVKLSD